MHSRRNALVYFDSGNKDYIRLIYHEFISYISISKFNHFSGGRKSCLNANTVSDIQWHEVKKIIDRVHKHICGHANRTDFQIILKRNNIWNNEIQGYVSKLIQDCRKCNASAPQNRHERFQSVLCLRIAMKYYMLITYTQTRYARYLLWT